MSTGKVAWAVATAVAFMAVGRDAHAFLDTGTLLTNAASATYMGGGQATQVTYSATAKILVANPAVMMWKDCTPTYVGTAGGYVTCVITYSNGGANTAFNVVITDRLPYNGAWVDCTAANQSNYLTGAATSATLYYSIGNPYGPWTQGCPPAGITAQAPGVFLHWVATPLGIGRSGVITFVLNVY